MVMDVTSGRLAGRLLLVSLFFFGLVFATRAAEGQTLGWRYDGSGCFPGVRPPVAWSADKNVVWKIALPGRSLGSPVAVKERVFVTAEPCDLLCVVDGEIEWRSSHTFTDVFGSEKGRQIEEDHEQYQSLKKQLNQLKRQRDEIKKASQSSVDAALINIEQEIKVLRKQAQGLTAYPLIPGGDTGNTTSTPVSDGENVFAVFGTGIVSSHALDGKRNWTVFVEPPRSSHSASPLLVGDTLIVHLRNLVALDARTGDVVWKAAVDARLGSPVAARIDEVDVVVTPSGAIVRVDDGAVLAKGQFNLRYCSPVVESGVAYATEDGAVKALKLIGDAGSGPIEMAVLWEVKAARKHRLASPVCQDGLLYNVTEQGVLEVSETRSGNLVYRKRLKIGGGRTDPSLCLAGGMLYVSGNRGTTLVVKTGRTYRELARNELEGFSSSLFFGGARMYVRTRKHLYCIGE